MKNCLFFIALAAILAAGNLAATAQKRLPGDKPQLIVEIVVGQMRSDYLLRYKDNFTSKGFRLFMDEGAFCHNARFAYMLTQTAPGLATIATGAYPAQHGITSDNWYDRANAKTTDAVYDAKAKSLDNNDANDAKSPKNLVANTFGDELKLFYRNTRTFGVAMEPEAAILLSGHTANGAYWWNSASGNFTSCSYYMKNLPEWVNEFNEKRFADNYLHRGWETIYGLKQYIASPGANRTLPLNDNAPLVFVASTEKSAASRNYAQLTETPYGDNLLKDFVTSLVVNENLGRGKGVDILTVYLSACKNVGTKYGAISIELEDALYRTDENIKHLMAFLHSQIGKENVLVVLTSDHGTNLSQKELKAARLPHGKFDSPRSMLLLRSYLNIAYGKGDWVKAFHQKQIYLNRTLIEDSNKNLSEVQNKAAEFLIQFAGVANVLTSTALESNNFGNSVMSNMQNGYYPKRSGDLILHLEPGWVESSDESNSNSPYNYDVHVPLAFYGWRTRRKSIATPVNMTDIAPTLATMIGAPLPNATGGKPIAEVWE